MIHPITPEQIAAVQARRDQEAAARLERLTRESPPELRNARAVQHLGVGDILTFRGRRFYVPPVGPDDGVALTQLSLEFAAYSFGAQAIAKRIATLAEQEGTDDNLDKLYGLIQEHAVHAARQLAAAKAAVAIFHRLVRPTWWLDRLTWRWRGNPFLNCDEYEINELFGFFCSRRMTPPIRHPLETTKTN